MINLLTDINAYIFTGGQSRRLHADKSLVQLHGKTLTEIVHQKLNLVFDNIYIVGKNNNFPDCNFIKDAKSVQCPLNGIVTALEHTQNDWIFVIACDLPLVNSYIINELHSNINSKAQVIAPSVNNRLQPLCAFYHKSVLKNFNSAIEKGNYSLMKLLNQIDLVKITILLEDEEQFLNINYPEDLARATELFKNIRQ